MKCSLDGESSSSFKESLQHLLKRHPEVAAKYLYNQKFNASVDLILKFSKAEVEEKRELLFA